METLADEYGMINGVTYHEIGLRRGQETIAMDTIVVRSDI